MTVKECYQKMDGNYEAAVRLMGSDERIIKYLKILQRDTNFSSLCKAIDQNDLETAFCAAHTLKGIALNLSLTSLADSTKELTEMLRSGMPDKNMGWLLQNTKRAYALVLECVSALTNM
ncbi:Hpt domain-containing protein [Candidatus Soleaferrea massiliensis]|uniref:Hpt domain-containing protein n=1 Tax=Candidatus Soleaferrea massiliensis TaxID=1470354 RepID=UPI00058F77BC|nr:Hpt domain-containing protein [Candidatus Soleaferrea massiliensis]